MLLSNMMSNVIPEFNARVNEKSLFFPITRIVKLQSRSSVTICQSP